MTHYMTTTDAFPGQETCLWENLGQKKIKSYYHHLAATPGKSQPHANVPAVEHRPLGTVVVLQACALHQRSSCLPLVGDSIPRDTEALGLCKWIPGQLRRLSGYRQVPLYNIRMMIVLTLKVVES